MWQMNRIAHAFQPTQANGLLRHFPKAGDARLVAKKRKVALAFLKKGFRYGQCVSPEFFHVIRAAKEDTVGNVEQIGNFQRVTDKKVGNSDFLFKKGIG